MSAAGSNVDMLRLEYPQSALELRSKNTAVERATDFAAPTPWARQLISQYTTAEEDLRQLYEHVTSLEERGSDRFQKIEQNYQILYETAKNLYDQSLVGNKTT